MVNDTTRLLGLDGLVVCGVTDGMTGPVVHLQTTDEVGRVCPAPYAGQSFAAAHPRIFAASMAFTPIPKGSALPCASKLAE